MTDNQRVWMLEIATFRGISIGAMHSYAVLRAPDPEDIPVPDQEGYFWDLDGQKWDIEKIMTAEQAKKLNEWNDLFGRDHSIDHVAGEPSRQFDSDEEAERFGTFVWNQVKNSDEDVLLRGSGFGSYGPAKVLGGPEAIVSELNRIFELWDRDESAVLNEEAEDSWHEAIKRLGLGPDHSKGGMTTTKGRPERPDNIYAYVAERDGELVLVDPYACTCNHPRYAHGDRSGVTEHQACRDCSCVAFEPVAISKPGDDAPIEGVGNLVVPTDG